MLPQLFAFTSHLSFDQIFEIDKIMVLDYFLRNPPHVLILHGGDYSYHNIASTISVSSYSLVYGLI